MHKSNAAQRGRVRLLFLDGLRGLAALYITLFHAHWQIDRYFHPVPLSAIASLVYSTLDYGHYAVAVFIVLSGYCLMLPVARSVNLYIPGGTGRYLLRRARRILPPYYAAFTASLLLISAVPVLQHPVSERWVVALPAFEFGPIISHLLLVHSFSPDWSSKINPPMWSVGVEWWIYFLFPAILLPTWRRFGMYASVGFAVVLGVGAHWIPDHRADFFCPWYFALFAFGAAAAYINFSPFAQRERSWKWSWIAVGSCALAVLLITFAPGWSAARGYFSDSVIGIGMSAFIVWCGKEALETIEPNLVLRILESPIILGLGTISYSLYLVHDPLLAILSSVLRTTKLSSEVQLTILVIGGGTASVAVAYIFYRLFERPFMVGHPKTSIKAAVSASIEPAP